MYKSLVIAGIALAAAAGWSTAHASSVATTAGSSFYINYDITLPAYPVSDLVLFEEGAPNPYPNGYGITFGGCCEYAGVGNTVITDPFLKTNPIISNFILGVATGLATDSDPTQQHLVVFSNDTFAAGAQGVSWDALFPNTDEDTLITDLTTNLDEAAVGETAYNQAINDLFTFANGDATNAGIGFGSSDTFSVTAFSSGQLIGTGFSFTTPGPAPEPETWALVLLGIGLTGAAVRTRRRMSSAVAAA